MRRYVFRLTMLALLVLAPSIALADDQDIAKIIVERLQQVKNAGELKNFSIDLAVDDGTVWMTGRVTSKDQLDRALDVARRVRGVKQVVNDMAVDGLAVKAAQPEPEVASPALTSNPAARSMRAAKSGAPDTSLSGLFANFAAGSGKRSSGASETGRSQFAAPAQYAQAPAAIGAGVEYAAAPAVPAPVPANNFAQPVPVAVPGPAQVQPAPYVYARPGAQMPVPRGVARVAAVQQGGGEAPLGAPVAMYGGSGVGIAPARYDHPQMPGYAWPAYASHPNYGAVTYPKQYSPSAWPYIGPFYPYPQVPLGWRKVTMQWDDGWWYLDFKNHRHRGW